MARGKEGNAIDRVTHAVRSLPSGRWVLAVSGGRDSMVLLDACARLRADVVAVATYDHGTGPAATAASAAVVAAAASRGLRVLAGAASATGTGAATTGAATAGAAPAGASPAEAHAILPDEASLRAARWAFLNAAAAGAKARIVTAHTRDDHVETVFMRLLRDAGPRGIAGMLAPSSVARPFIELRRDDLAAYAAAARVSWVEDPSNASLQYLRNRVRLELLPAFERARPGFSAWLLSLSRRSAAWRTRVATVVDALVGWSHSGQWSVTPDVLRASGTLVVPAAEMGAFSEAELAVLWPELAGRLGIVLDRRGLERLVREAPHLGVGGRIPLSGGAVVERTTSSYVVRNPTGSGRLY